MQVALVYGYDLHIVGRYLEEAFIRGGHRVLYWGPPSRGRVGFAPDESIGTLLEGAGSPPHLLLHAEGYPSLPRGLEEVPFATSCILFDTWIALPYRVAYAALFDAVFVSHAEFVPVFQDAGHPRVFHLPHATDASIFAGARVDSERDIEIGWVGRTDGRLYTRRQRILPLLERRFSLNDWRRSYSREEMGQVYRRSKVVVNISRDDFPQEANMRCFEAMAAGSLLVTAVPTELTALGFAEGRHFVGFATERDLVEKLGYFLAHRSRRLEIAARGQELVLREHTYDARRETIIRVTQGSRGQAPARRWGKEDASRAYLAYYVCHGLWECALRRWRELRSHSWHAGWRALPSLLRGLARAVVQGG